MQTPLYIFGLSDVLGRPDPSGEMVANDPVTRTACALTIAGAEVWVWSGRPYTQADEAWVRRHVPTFGQLRMRGVDEWDVPSDQLKAYWLRSLSEADRSRLVAAFDYASRNVVMWMREGVQVFQVCPAHG